MSEDWTDKPGRHVMGVRQSPVYDPATFELERPEHRAARGRTEEEEWAIQERINELFPQGDAKTYRPTSHRELLLTNAERLVMGDRNNTHGEPHQDFSRTAGVLNSLGYRGPDGRDLQPHDVALMMMAVKMSRLMWSPGHLDNWTDIAGYAACGHEAYELTEEVEA